MQVMRTGIWMVMGVALLVGCAANKQAMRTKIGDLERQVARLEAENANLQAKAKALDDALLVYKKKLEARNESADVQRHQTVRLRPQGAASSDEPVVVSLRGAGRQDVVSLSASAPDRVQEDGRRPVLRMTGNRVERPRASRAVPAAFQVPPTGRGDNLGVVDVAGAPAPATGGDASGASDALALFHAAYRSYNNGEYAAALAGFAEFLRTESNHRYADDALYWRGECFFALRQHFKAIGEFERVVRRYPNANKAPDAMYRVGIVYERVGDKDKAAEYFFRVVERYPGTEAARKASKKMASAGASGTLVSARGQR